MRVWAAAIVAVGMGSGCNYGPYTFRCTDGASCGAAGTCEANGFCSFPDGTCSSGRRYGDLGGPSGPSGQCVDSLPPGDARVCFGAAPFTVCFTTPPTGSIDVSMPTTFNTDTGTVTGTQLNCAAPMSGGTGYCVFAADTITINQPLRAIGTKPLVLVAANSIDVANNIDVGSHRMGAMDSIGAGADPTTGCNAGTRPSGGSAGGGGAGGSFMGAGGDGGAGSQGRSQHGLATGFGTVLRGGCPGQDGAVTGHGAGGHGGGAVFLIAGNRITVGGTINAGGEGGGGGTGNTAGGGGGGGAGGLIGFDAMTITVTGTLIANGGGGGEGGQGGSTANGNPGSDANSTNLAPGGANGGSGGDGGEGSAYAVAGPGTVGRDGNGGGAGGGGGGGGAGLIKGPPASLGTQLSPAAIP